MSGSGACPRCTEGSLELDPTDGFVICTSCGFVSDDTCLETQAWGQEGGGSAWRAAEGGGASSNVTRQAVNTEAFGRGVGSSYDREREAAYRLRKQVDEMEGLGSALKLPASVIQEAGHLLREYKAAPTLPGAPRAWGVVQAATLYLAARQAGLGLVIPEVAAAMATNIWVVGASYRHVCRTLGITPPAANLRSLVIRFASEFITQRYTSNSSNTGNTGNTATVGTAGGPLAAATGAGGPAGGHDDGGGGPLIASRNRHPLMKCAVQLAELLMRAGIGEGRQNNTLAAAVLMLAAEAQPPPSLPQRSKLKVANEVSALVGVQRSTAAEVKALVVADLLKLAQQLPFAAMVNRQNVLSYIPILSTLAGTLEFMRNMGPWVQAASPSLQLSQGGGAGAELGPASQQGVPPTLSPGAPVVHSGREGQRGPTETVLATLPGAPPAAIAVSAVGTAAAAGAAAAAGTPAVAWQLRGDAAGAGAAGAQTKESMLSTGQLAGRHFATQADTVPHTDMQKHKQLGAQVWTWAGTEWGTQEGRQGVMQAVTEWDTQGSRQGVTQASTQAQTQGGTKGGTQGGTQAGAQAGPIALSGRVRPKTVTPGSRTAQAARQAGGGQTTAGARVGVVGAGLAEAGAAGAGAAGARAAGAGAAAGQQATPLARAAVASSLESWQRGVDDVCGGDARAAGAAAAAFHLSGKRPHCDEGEGEGEVRLAKKAGQQGSGQGAAVDGGMQGAALEALGAEPAAQDRPAKRPELWQPADGEQDDARVALGLMTMEEVRWERAQARATAAAAGEAGTAT